LDRARDPARIQEYADAHTTAKLRLTELQTKQIETIATINELNTKLGANVDVIELVGEAAALTATPLANFDTAGTDIALTYGATNTGVNALLNRTAVSMTTLGQQTPTAAAGITSVGTALGNLAGVDQTKISGINTLASSMSALSSATTSLRGVDFKGILGGVSSAAESLTSAVVARWGTLGTSLNAVATALAKIREENQAGGGGGNGGGGTSNEDAIRATIQMAFNDKYLSQEEFGQIALYASQRGYNADWVTSAIQNFLTSVGSDYTTFNTPVFGRSLPEVPPGMDSKPGNGRNPTDSATRGSQTINITLNYATPPDSKNPLKDVEDYIAAQGGLIRI
jgi:hypothetical protein